MKLLLYLLVINMEIKNIKLDNIDDNSRAVTIKTSGKNIITPNKSITSSEINKIKSMRLKSDEPPSPFDVADEKFPWQIYQVDMEYKEKIRKNIAQNYDGLNKKISNIKSRVNIINKMLTDEENKNIIKILYPKTVRNDIIPSEFMTALIELEVKIGVDVITIPEPTPGCSFDMFERNLKNVSRFLDDLGNTKPLMPIIDSKSNADRFNDKLNFIRDQFLNYNKNFGLMGIASRVFSSHINLHKLRNDSDKFEHFWIHGFGAYRNSPSRIFYNPHACTLWGIDTVGVTPQRGFPQINKNNSNFTNVKKLRIYDKDSWGIYKEPKEFIDKNLCDCEGCNYYRKSSKFEKLQSSLDVHEIIQSYNQITKSRRNIQENDYINLIKQKKYFKNYYEDSIKDI